MTSYMTDWLLSNLNAEDIKYFSGVADITSAVAIYNKTLETGDFKSFIIFPVWNREKKILMYQVWVYLPDLVSYLNHTVTEADGLTEKTYSQLTSHFKPFNESIASNVIIMDSISTTYNTGTYISAKDAKKLINIIISSYSVVGDTNNARTLSATINDLLSISEDVLPNLMGLILFYKLRVMWGNNILE